MPPTLDWSDYSDDIPGEWVNEAQGNTGSDSSSSDPVLSQDHCVSLPKQEETRSHKTVCGQIEESISEDCLPSSPLMSGSKSKRDLSILEVIHRYYAKFILKD